jgi:hypothetical protein
MRVSDWQYLGYVLTAVGVSLVMTGGIALYSIQQRLSQNMPYESYFLPVSVAGILFMSLGLISLGNSLRKKRSSIPPPQLPQSAELPPPPP